MGEAEGSKSHSYLAVFRMCKEEDPGNYRLVIVTLNSGKVMEQILLEVICKCIKDKKMIRSGGHGFTKGKSCLAKLIAFYDEMTSSVDSRRALDVIYYDFIKFFDTISVTAS